MILKVMDYMDIRHVSQKNRLVGVALLTMLAIVTLYPLASTGDNIKLIAGILFYLNSVVLMVLINTKVIKTCLNKENLLSNIILGHTIDYEENLLKQYSVLRNINKMVNIFNMVLGLILLYNFITLTLIVIGVSYE